MLVNIPHLTRCLDAGTALIKHDIQAYKARTYRITNLVCVQLEECDQAVINLIATAVFLQELSHWGHADQYPLIALPHHPGNLGPGRERELLHAMRQNRCSLRRQLEPLSEAYRVGNWVNAWSTWAPSAIAPETLSQLFLEFPTTRLDVALRGRFLGEAARHLLRWR